MSTPPKLRLAIVGGGIGGLTLAVALSHLGLDEFLHVDVYESAAKLTQVGAGIALGPRTWEVMKDLGMAGDLEARMAPGGAPPDQKEPRLTFSFRKSDEPNGSPFFDLITPGGMATYHRADLQEILLNHVSSFVHCHLNHRLVNYRETKEGIELEFKNGETTSCDILVGADGINSVVRRVFLANKCGLDPSSEEALTNAAPVWSGMSVYRGLVDSEVIKGELPNHRALTTPIGDGRCAGHDTKDRSKRRLCVRTTSGRRYLRDHVSTESNLIGHVPLIHVPHHHKATSSLRQNTTNHKKEHPEKNKKCLKNMKTL